MIYFLENVPDNIDESAINDIIDWACGELNLTGTDIELTFVWDTLPRGATGVTECEEDGEYKIILKRGLPEYELMKTVLHEIVHVMQYVNGNHADMHNICGRNDDYHNRPWEIEAYRREKELLIKYLK